MAWWDSFSGSTDAGSLYGFGNMISDFASSGSGGGASTGSNAAGWLGTIGSVAKGLFSGSGDSGGNGSSIWGSILSGLGTGAAAYLSGEDLKENTEAKGLQDRKSLSFAAQLEDYYNQKNKSRDRAAVDTYGQYSLMNRIMPTTSTPVEVPTLPTP